MNIPSVCRQHSLFRCPGVSLRLSASHGPATSSGQQLLKLETGRKQETRCQRLSVSAPRRAGQESHRDWTGVEALGSP